MLGAGAREEPPCEPGGHLHSSSRRTKDDRGVVQIIEAVMVGLLVVGAISFAIAFQVAPPPSSSVGAQDVREVTWDALDSINTLYYDDPAYDNRTISKTLADAAAGETDGLVDTLGAFLPTGSLYNVYLNNGFDRIPLYENRTPGGQTVGVSYPIEPNWRYHYTNPDLGLYDADTERQTLGLTMIPTLNSNHVQDEGAMVEVQVSGNQRWMPGTADPIFKAGGPMVTWPKVPFVETAVTSLVENNGSADPSYPSATIHLQCWRDADGDGDPESVPGVKETEPCYAIDLQNGGGGNMTGYGPREFRTNKIEARLDFAIHNDGPGTLPAGTQMTIHFPIGMPVIDDEIQDGDGNFSVVEVKDRFPNSETVEATLGHSMAPGETREIQIWVRIRDSRYAYKTIDARLDGGSVSQSNLLAIVKNKAEGTYTGGDTRVAYLSGPRPAGSCAVDTDPCPATSRPVGRWGIVLPMPFGPGAINEINFTLPRAEGLLTDASWPADFNPTYTPNVREQGTLDRLDANTVTWVGHYEVDGYEFVEFQFEITSRGNVSAASPNLPSAAPKSSFTGYDPPPHAIQVEPGIWWREVPPKYLIYPGYGMSQTDENVETREIEARLVHRNALLTGDTTYKLTSLASGNPGGLRDAIHSASLTPADRFLAIGETANVRLNSTDLASFLADEVGLNSMAMETDIYAPWGLPSQTPVASYTHQAASSALSYGEAILPVHLDNDGIQDVLLASTDGNVYGLSGTSGIVMPGFTFALPESQDPQNPTKATHLSRARLPGVGPQFAVGTSEGGKHIYLLDDEVDEQWRALKPEETVKTYALNTSLDVTDDDWPDVVTAFAAEQVEDESPFGNTRIVLYSGEDSGIGVGNDPDDGIGEVVPGWGWMLDDDEVFDEDIEDEGVVLNGTTWNVGMGKIGSKGEPGVWADTGLHVAHTGLYTVKTALNNFNKWDPAATIEDLNHFSVNIKDAGLVGFRSDARKTFNYTGGRFVEVLRADELDVGSDWSGMVAGSPDGYVYGFNGSKPHFPVGGYQIVGGTKWNDIAMSNELEGYSAETDGRMYATRDGWTSFKNHVKKLDDQDSFLTRVHPGVLTVDTPETKLGASDASKVSWWGGRSGLLLRSVDRLETVDTLSTTGQLQAIVSLSSSDLELEPKKLETISFTDMDFVDSFVVDENEAWFIANRDRPLTGNVSYIVRSTDGGLSWEVTEFQCNEGGRPLGECTLHAMDFDGERLWLVGNYGTVLVQDITGDATKVDLAGSDGINADGVLPIELDTSKTVSIDAVKVGWNNIDELEWMREVRLDVGAGNESLWHRDGGETFVDPLTSYDPLFGVNAYAKLDTDGYTIANGTPGANELSGVGTLYVGPFKTTLDPLTGYYGGADFDTKFPLNFTVNITYADDSMDHFYVHLNETGAVTVNELSTAVWTTPDQIGFTVPSDCFGLPDGLCTHIHGINVSKPRGSPVLAGGAVGERQPAEVVGGTVVVPEQPPLFTLTDTVWSARTDFDLNQTFKDIAFNLADPTRWVMVGENSRVATSYNAGLNWIELPTPTTTGDVEGHVLETVDFTHPHVPVIGGGEATGILWMVDGYTEHGQVITYPLEPNEGGTVDPIKHMVFQRNGGDMVFGEEASGNALVSIKVWDPDANGANQGAWMEIYSSTEGWDVSYSFQEKTDEIKLKVELSNPTPGFSRFSPQARGQVFIEAYTDEDAQPSDPPNYTFTFDTNDTSVIDSGLDIVDHSLASGYRLMPVHNPWVLKLGNEESGDWSKIRSNKTGARVADMELAENGTILWVGTEKIYEWGALPEDTPVADPDGDELYAEDNSLYAIDVNTGQLADWWEPAYFEDPIEFVNVAGDAVYITTYDPDESTSEPVIWRLPFDWDGTNHQDLHALGIFHDVKAATVARIDPAVEGNLVYSLLNLDTLEGMVTALDVEKQNGDVKEQNGQLTPRWDAQPQVKGLFDFSYEVPRSAAFGAYVMVTTIQWEITTEDGDNLLQTARVHNSFTVTPPNGKVPIAPTYNLEVISWMEDWG